MNSCFVTFIFLAVTLLVVVAVNAAAISNSTKNNDTSKDCEGLASYRLVVETFWSKETFNKQYPIFRPSAQWSKLIGRSHNERYVLWSVGTPASEGIKEFSEKASSTDLETEIQGNFGIYDTFVGPNIAAGVGQSIVKFLAHPRYSKVSFIVRMIPSPDWFIGVDSVDLCKDGQWMLERTIDLHPYDAGTDRGFTFTSPKWPEYPAKPIEEITAQSPNHPAGSFFYPDLDSLPPIARLKLTRIDLRWNDTALDDRSNKKMAIITKTEVRVVEETEIDVPKLKKTDANVDDSKQTTNYRRQLLRNGKTNISKTKVIGTMEGRIDCEVSEWNEWSSCSKTCGFGIRSRSRSVIRRPKNGGRPCSLLREEQLCGSMRNCGIRHFSWELTSNGDQKQ